jgi:hypothetical protein
MGGAAARASAARLTGVQGRASMLDAPVPAPQSLLEAPMYALLAAAYVD